MSRPFAGSRLARDRLNRHCGIDAALAVSVDRKRVGRLMRETGPIYGSALRCLRGTHKRPTTYIVFPICSESWPLT